MSSGRGRLFIGTSGWSYDHWRGPFYPEGLPGKSMLQAYSRKFSTVEINSSFYRLPSQETVASWRDTVPPDFVFSVKASRYITHMKKLIQPGTTTRGFLDRISALGERLGPILFQLPPHWSVNERRLEAFLGKLPPEFRYAFEFRDRSWFDDRVFSLLKRCDVALCIYDLAGFRSPEAITANFVYVRMHGPVGTYAGSYSDKVLSEWAGKLTGWSAGGREVFCYFNNDMEAYAAKNASRLCMQLGLSQSESRSD